MVMIAQKKECQVKGSFIVKNDRGLHTRPSTEIVRCTSAFKSEVLLRYQKMEVNAKSILGILMLAAIKGAKITVSAFGEDAEEVVASLIDLAEKQFYITY
ncbi:MAG: Phosphocarrier protein HPr [Chlamydiae bacterium]|nr:Phosphocarrier protein HPr [Chlamydiota bacterium]